MRRCDGVTGQRGKERRGIDSVLHLGVRDPTRTGLEAHAWLDAGGLNVTGYPVDPALTEVARFV